MKKQFLFIALFFLFSVPVFSIATITNLSIAPLTVAQGSDITVQFDMGVGGSTNISTYFAIGLSENNTNPPLRCGTDWVATHNGIYKNFTQYWVDGNTLSASASGITQVQGLMNGGLSGPVWGAVPAAPKHVSAVITIPPEYSNKTYYVIVLVIAAASPALSYHCDFDPQLYDSAYVLPVTVSGTQSAYKLDLQCYGQTSNTTSERVFYKVFNRSESGVKLNRLAARYYVYKTPDVTWTALTSPNIRVRLPDNSTLSNDVMSFSAMTQAPLTEATCAFLQMANRYVQANFPDPQSGKANGILLPPGGGSAETQSEYQIGPSNGINQPDNNFYYSKASDNTVDFVNYKYVTVHLDGVHVCEWSSSSVQDANSGEAPCGTPGACGVLSTATITPSLTVTATLTQTITPTQTINLLPTATCTRTGIPVVIGELESYANPNPATFYVYFNYNMPKPAENIRVDIVNFAGRYAGFVEEKSVNAIVAKIKLNLYKFAPGMYYYITRIKYMDGEQVKYKPAKFMVAK